MIKKIKDNPIILVVDDSNINRGILEKILCQDYEVVEAGNGQEALTELENHPEIEAVLLDLRMPVMDGYEFMSMVRESKKNRNLPIIAVTAMEGNNSEIKALDSGADDYIIKPVEPRIVLKRLGNIIRLQRAIKKANHDMMTKLLNRGAFLDQAEKMLDAVDTHTKCAFYVIDLDDFKKANDTLGHTYGDTVLIDFGRRLQQSLGDNMIAGRMGGDEFAVFVCGYADETEVTAMAETCMQAMSGLHVSKLQAAPTCSVGVAIYPKDGTEISRLYYAADQALYESKGLGKNRYSIYGTGRTVEDKTSNNDLSWVLDELDAYIYICDVETHDVYYANAKALNLINEADGESDRCFCHLMGLGTDTCCFCGKHPLGDETSCSALVKNVNTDTPMFYKAMLVNWDGKPARVTVVCEMK